MNHPATIGRLDSVVCWLKQSDRASARWLGQHCVVVAWLGLLLAVISPPHGLGFALCWFQHVTGLPCPGCGMTRSLSCGIRGMFLESWQHHPMGLLILAMFFVIAVQSVLPDAVRDRFARFIEARAVVFNTFYLVFVAAFVGFGAIRALLHFSAVFANFN